MTTNQGASSELQRVGPSAEQQFYIRHHGGGLSVSSDLPDDLGQLDMKPGRRYSLVAERLPSSASPGDTLLELGCGSGHALKIMSTYADFGQCIGVDVAFLEARSINNISFLNANLNEAWPFPDNSIDHVVAMMIFEHLFDPFHSFSELARILSPNGVAYVNLPLVTSAKNRIRLLLGLLPITSVSKSRWFVEREWDGNHLHYFSLPSIRELTSAVGLRLDEVRGVGRFHQAKSMFPSLLAGEVTFSVRKS